MEIEGRPQIEFAELLKAIRFEDLPRNRVKCTLFSGEEIIFQSKEARVFKALLDSTKEDPFDKERIAEIVHPGTTNPYLIDDIPPQISRINVKLVGKGISIGKDSLQKTKKKKYFISPHKS